jgi:hypothetical protein
LISRERAKELHEECEALICDCSCHESESDAGEEPLVPPFEEYPD